MKTWKAVALGCGALALIGIVVLIVGVVFVAHVSKDLEGVVVTVNGPPEGVQVGQTFDLEIVVKNERARKVLQLSDVDLAEEYLDGFTVSAIKPAQKSSMHVPVTNCRSFTFDVSIAAGASQSFVFTLKAEKAGLFRGDVDVYEGLRCLTTMAQTVVREKD